MDKFFIQVGFTNTRPIIVDEFITFVTVLANSDAEAKQIAAQMAGVRAEMVTSTVILMMEV